MNKYLYLILMFNCAYAADFSALKTMYDQKTQVLHAQQQETINNDVALYQEMQNRAVFKMNNNYQKVEPVQEVAFAESTNINVYLPEKEKTVWENVKSSIPNLLTTAVLALF